MKLTAIIEFDELVECITEILAAQKEGNTDAEQLAEEVVQAFFVEWGKNTTVDTIQVELTPIELVMLVLAIKEDKTSLL